ncbi:hypothetical protein BD310DRAFT_413149 [Dichomitus squalens]|uniref:Uncharacterized protein n=1 Tax=Dichomitus squalens TaxID=114155 RepID=A0A4Q9PYK0_9APHY|nr:hypothetical protein BD310DRAFT_413149 [Dichomitus squalens]
MPQSAMTFGVGSRRERTLTTAPLYCVVAPCVTARLRSAPLALPLDATTSPKRACDAPPHRISVVAADGLSKRTVHNLPGGSSLYHPNPKSLAGGSFFGGERAIEMKYGDRPPLKLGGETVSHSKPPTHWRSQR